MQRAFQSFEAELDFSRLRPILREISDLEKEYAKEEDRQLESMRRAGVGAIDKDYTDSMWLYQSKGEKQWERDIYARRRIIDDQLYKELDRLIRQGATREQLLGIARQIDSQYDFKGYIELSFRNVRDGLRPWVE